jgi:uncharacterized protein
MISSEFGSPPGAHTPGSLSRVLGLFAKQPLPGLVKTRLAEALSTDWAARIANAFLLDAVERLSQIDAGRVLAFSPSDAHDYFAGLTNGNFALRAQIEGDLGQRMAEFFEEFFRAGAHSVVIVGTDSPTLPLAFIEQAFEELARVNVVLGPATDGGYYLIGCARPLRGFTPPARLFDNIAWSTSGVLHDTVQRLTAARCRLALLPPWYDIDTLDDWRMLQGHVAAQRQAGQDPGVPHTERLLQCQVP